MKYEIPIYQVQLVRDTNRTEPLESICGPEDTGKILQEYLAGADREHFVVLMLDTRNHIIGITTVSIGSLSASIVHPREVFKAPILCNANTIILGHNHPGMDCTPSEEDQLVTKRLVEAGLCLGIQVLDHIIVSDDCMLSFREAGLMKASN